MAFSLFFFFLARLDDWGKGGLEAREERAWQREREALVLERWNDSRFAVPPAFEMCG